jgi:glutamyl-Q tRNA(Asp) synthetase
MRGRFAPSPTGPLHFGSLVAAVGSFLDARAHGGSWLVRIEDVDLPRAVPGAADQILRTIEAFHLHWDGPVVYQSERTEIYREVFNRLVTQGDVFPCSCSRRELDGQRYPGTCRNGATGPPRAWRLRVPDGTIRFQDRRLGPHEESLAETCGDFPLLRADGLFAYQLAVVVDDADQAVDLIVRGADLLDSTGRQIYLHQRWACPCRPTSICRLPWMRMAKN